MSRVDSSWVLWFDNGKIRRIIEVIHGGRNSLDYQIYENDWEEGFEPMKECVSQSLIPDTILLMILNVLRSLNNRLYDIKVN